MTAALVAVLGGPALAAASPSVAAVERSAVAQTTTTPARAPRDAKSTDANRYAARETQAQNLENFKGGAAIYIGGTALAVAALIVLILVLI